MIHNLPITGVAQYLAKAKAHSVPIESEIQVPTFKPDIHSLIIALK